MWETYKLNIHIAVTLAHAGREFVFSRNLEQAFLHSSSYICRRISAWEAGEMEIQLLLLVAATARTLAAERGVLQILSNNLSVTVKAGGYAFGDN